MGRRTTGGTSPARAVPVPSTGSDRDNIDQNYTDQRKRLREFFGNDLVPQGNEARS